MKQNSARIGIVIPAWNEATVIGEVLKHLPRTIAGHPVDIIVVTDGSSDGTDKEVAKFDDVIMINHIINSGAGAATRTGLRYARQMGYDFVATMDGDGQHHPEDVEKVVKAALDGRGDMIIGSRLKDAKGMIWYRWIGNVGLSFLTYLIFGAWVMDSQSGLKAFNKKGYAGLNYHTSGYGFCSEMVWRAKQQKLRIAEVPIRAIYTEYSLKGKVGQSNLDAFKLLRQLIKQRLMGFMNE